MKTAANVLKAMGSLAILLLVIFGPEVIPGRGWDWLGGFCVLWYLGGLLRKALGGIRTMSERLTTMSENTAAIAADVDQINRRWAAIAADVSQINRRGAAMALQQPKVEEVESPHSYELSITSALLQRRRAAGGGRSDGPFRANR